MTPDGITLILDAVKASSFHACVVLRFLNSSSVASRQN